MNSLALGGILKRFYPSFSMTTFSNRLKLQKIIYLIQSDVTNLGYVYEWYLYGPYSTQLTKDAYNIQEYAETKPIAFEDKVISTKFDEFIKKIEPHKDDTKWLEVASSIHLLKKLYPQKTKSDIIVQIQNKRGNNTIDKTFISNVWLDVEGWLI